MPLPADIVQRIRQAKHEGLDESAVADLSRTYAASGVQLQFPGKPTADIASTGGPSSLSTLLAPLLLRAFGYAVPKLGVPGRPAGGLDVLAQVPGYSIDLAPQQVLEAVDACGYAHFISNGRYAPLDAETFTYRQTIAAQQCPDLVIASLLSKKLAVGVRKVGLDVRVAPHGNFGATIEEARVHSEKFVRVARKLDLEAVCILSNATQPLQPYIGRGEALWALEKIFNGTADPWLTDHVEKSALMVEALSGRAAIPSAEPLASFFAANLTAQGADPRSLEKVAARISLEHQHLVVARRRGIISYDLAKMRDAFVAAQRSHSASGQFPDPIGVRLLVRPGMAVEVGQPLMTVRAAVDVWSEFSAVLYECATYDAKLDSSVEAEVVNGE